jgi:uncharacterized protein
MARMLSRVAPWLRSADSPQLPPSDVLTAGAEGHPLEVPGQSSLQGPRPDGEVRVLEDGDTDVLWALVNQDPVANIFVASHLEVSGTAASTPTGARMLGYFDAGTMVSACWAGVNVVPVAVTAETGPAFGQYLGESGRRFSSIFGPAEGVLAIWSRLQWATPRPFDVRPNQPLLEIRSTPKVAANTGLRATQARELDILLPACVAMFEEEVGYSPTSGGDNYYRHRVRGFIQRRHSFIDVDPAGQVIFKAELGTVSSSATQIQGVWMNPASRGQGLSAGYMASMVNAARQVAPVTSLYVNDYNARALATYRTVGFEQVGTFATVLF